MGGNFHKKVTVLGGIPSAKSIRRLDTHHSSQVQCQGPKGKG
jgi:hypothetical protein